MIGTSPLCLSPPPPHPGLHSALLRLLATNYPHLCMVEDWISEEEITGTLPLLRRMLLTSATCRYSQQQLQDGECARTPPPTIQYWRHAPNRTIPHVYSFCRSLSPPLSLLSPSLAFSLSRSLSLPPPLSSSRFHSCLSPSLSRSSIFIPCQGTAFPILKYVIL